MPETVSIGPTSGSIHSNVKDQSTEEENDQTVPKRSVIGIGGGKDYTLYDPARDHIEFLSADQKPALRARGFGLNV